MPEPGEELTDVELDLRDLSRKPGGVVKSHPEYSDHPLSSRPDQPVFPPPLGVVEEVELDQTGETASEEE